MLANVVVVLGLIAPAMGFGLVRVYGHTQALRTWRRVCWCLAFLWVFPMVFSLFLPGTAFDFETKNLIFMTPFFVAIAAMIYLGISVTASTQGKEAGE